MKIFEGRFFLLLGEDKYALNLAPTVRPLTIDCLDRREFNKELERIKESFLKLGDDITGEPVYKIHFEMQERRNK